MKKSEPKPDKTTGERRIEYMRLEDLKPAKKNPKDHAIGDISESMTRFGYTEGLLFDERTGRLVAGHGRLETLQSHARKGDKAPDGIKIDKTGQWLVPVQRGWSSRDDKEAEAYLVASNRLVEVGGWDQSGLNDLLASMAEQGEDSLKGVGYDHDDVFKMLRTGDLRDESVDDAPAPVVDPWVMPGDKFQLGQHQIWCGDCIDTAGLESFLGPASLDACWTDPPWNVAYGDKKVPGGWSSKHAPIQNDNLGAAFPKFAQDFCAAIAAHVKPGAALYMAMSAQEWPVIHAALKAAGFHWSSTIIWAKDSLVLSRKDYHTQYEPIWYGWREGAARSVVIEDRTQSDLWQIPRPKKSDVHPSMKPIELVERALINSTKRGDLVFEPFSGSGSTLIACERTGRKCRAVELSPAYVQVTIERWETETGSKHQKVGTL